MTFSFHQPNASTFVPSGRNIDHALIGTTHLGIVAHQDDLEIAAFHGITSCYQIPQHGFGGIVCADGANSPRSGKFTSVTSEEMKMIRRREQESAAQIGEYTFITQLDYESSSIKDINNKSVSEDLIMLLSQLKLDTLYTHHPFDRHSTHVAVFQHVVSALRQLPESKKPKHVYGCEVWRSLDWLPQRFRVELDVSSFGELSNRLLSVYESQNQGGKRYNIATSARRASNATFAEPRKADLCEELILAIDLMPLVNQSMKLFEYIETVLFEFKKDILEVVKT